VPTLRSERGHGHHHDGDVREQQHHGARQQPGPAAHVTPARHADSLALQEHGGGDDPDDKKRDKGGEERHVARPERGGQHGVGGEDQGADDRCSGAACRNFGVSSAVSSFLRSSAVRRSAIQAAAAF
jgi:hypothetical protein